MPLDTRDLEVLLAVAREGSFGRAATALLVTQPAVSERIRHLERVVATPLVQRSSRGATLTAAGEELLPYATRCVALAAEGLEAARSASGASRFVVAVHSTFGPRVVPMVLGALSAMPRRVSVRDAHSDEVLALVADGVADVGFSIPASVPSGIRRSPLPPDPVVAVVAAGHPLARRRSVAPRGLRDALLAINLWGEGAERFVAGLREAAVDEWRMRFCADAATALALVREHGHVGFVASSSATDDLASGRLHRIAMPAIERWRVNLQVVHRADRAKDETIVAVLRAVREASGSPAARAASVRRGQRARSRSTSSRRS
jgi:DNA-binding transcriptional LysR family regulator